MSSTISELISVATTIYEYGKTAYGAKHEWDRLRKEVKSILYILESLQKVLADGIESGYLEDDKVSEHIGLDELCGSYKRLPETSNSLEAQTRGSGDEWHGR